jgi:hypothetical protein
MDSIQQVFGGISMKGRLWWSSVLPLAGALCLSFEPNTAKAADATININVAPQGPTSVSMRSGSRRPGLINPLCGTVGGPAITSPECDSQSGREWEGITSTDYFTYEPNVFAPPNPDIAVGPDDILTVVNRTIARYPNPNAPTATNSGGTAPVTYNPANTFYFPPTSRQFLDVWLGEAAINELCPTFPRSNSSCEISNASVRYDQMQGRFVVLFTVVDTGLIHCNGCAGVVTQQGSPQRRKASWVMIVSKWATGCQGNFGTGFGAGCGPNTTPAVPGLTGNTEFFTTPQPPGPSQSNPNSGGINGNWISYYGAPDGTCTSPCPYGNINSISDLRAGLTAPQGARTIDCDVTAVNDTTRVCYFPSSARLGLDNDNIVIVSSVYNDNVPLAARSYVVNQTTFNSSSPAWEGTRLRVHKKSGFYIGTTSVPGATGIMRPGCSQCATQVQGDFYDLWGASTTPYTFDLTITQPVPGGGSRDVVGCNYEPDHVRGRSLATFNGHANLANAFSSIWCTVDQPFRASVSGGGTAPPQILIYHRSIAYTRLVTGTINANQGAIPPVVDTAKISGAIPSLQALQSVVVPAFTNPDNPSQRIKLAQPAGNNQLGTPWLYVGDDRPHRAISREGHVYVARVVNQPGQVMFPATGGASLSRVWTTVVYDVIQKLGPGSGGFDVINTSWGNGQFYAPMYDTPANVVLYGSISPINVQPFLEKLFVGTTFPPLAPTDSRTFSYGLTSGVALAACKGQEPAVNSTTGALAYPGLFDMRCGEDAYDAAQAYRHPVSAAFTPSDFGVNFGTTEGSPTFPAQIVPMGIRGGAATDPNNMGLWNYGAYAKGRLASLNGFGQWGTYVAHYPLTFPLRDPYNNLIGGYGDVQPGNPFFTFVQIAKQTEIDPGSRTAAAGSTFGVNDLVTRQQMARWVVRAQMDERAITNYLNSTGGLFCSFADVTCPSGSTVTDTTGNQSNGDWRYIETMYRRGYTKGCGDTNDGQRRFCPTLNLSRGEMAVFIIRAKMNSVFPTVTSGAFTTTSCQPGGTLVGNVGDQFGLFVGCTPYFTDVPSTHIFFSFIQKIRELRISNGTSLSPATYEPNRSLTKGELMTFLVRGFFP